MFLNKDMNKIARVFVIVFLCSEIQSSGFTQTSTFEYQAFSHSTKINSTEAFFGDAQHHASIRVKKHDQNLSDDHICSGVVVGSSAVLTTAQCVYNYNTNKPYHPSELKVVLATTSHYQHQDYSLVFSVTHSYQHEQFNAISLSDNVAILMLDRDIPKLNEYVQPITLRQTTTTHNPNWYDKHGGGKLKVTTWLKTKEGLYLNHLMLLNASKVSDEICQQYYGQSVFGSGMLCVSSNELLNKDWGSPLFVENVLVGVKSFSLGHPSPAIYTDVSHHAEWISSIIGDGSNQNSSIWGSLGFILLTVVALKRTNFMK